MKKVFIWSLGKLGSSLRTLTWGLFYPFKDVKGSVLLDEKYIIVEEEDVDREQDVGASV